MNVIVVTTKLPNRATALELAQQLLASKLAACVNIHAPCYSIYHWQGKIESAEEIPLALKTTEAHYAAVEQMIRQQHPYELPEIICVPVLSGLPDYLHWVAETVNK